MTRRYLRLFTSHACRAAAGVVVGSLVVVGALAATSSPATATTGTGTGTMDAALRATAATSTVPAPLSASVRSAGGSSAASSAVAYWTPERMRNAVPDDRPTLAADPATTPSRRTTTPAGSTAPSAPISGVRAAVNASATVGRVFFYNPADGFNHSCSGSALNSNSKRLVITAGHCVHSGSGGVYMQNWVFVPLYNYGSRPYGTFAARTYRTFDAWRNSGSRDHDAAMVTTWNNESNQLLVNTVGGNGLSWNYSHSISLTILAYPADPPYDGTWQQYCQGTTQQVGLFDGRIEMQCGFTGGSSGGPWLRAYDNATGLGYVNGVMSTLASGGWNRSSYFDDKVKTMLDATVND